jgi:hypothetical protein
MNAECIDTQSCRGLGDDLPGRDVRKRDMAGERLVITTTPIITPASLFLDLRHALVQTHDNNTHSLIDTNPRV